MLAEFDEFLENNNITRRRSWVGYPQSNRAAERAVQSFKRLYEKKAVDKELWQGVWALWRNTPQQPGQYLLHVCGLDVLYNIRNGSPQRCRLTRILWRRPRKISVRDRRRIGGGTVWIIVLSTQRWGENISRMHARVFVPAAHHVNVLHPQDMDAVPASPVPVNFLTSPPELGRFPLRGPQSSDTG